VKRGKISWENIMFHLTFIESPGSGQSKLNFVYLSCSNSCACTAPLKTFIYNYGRQSGDEKMSVQLVKISVEVH